ncbi:MAG: Helix-turn-helix domain [Thermoplasmata archaeon]|jgi:DNA-binding transcriptional ArsR family regulator|nr:Helix-turn-helix domain [Thermoplasmata archaeon]
MRAALLVALLVLLPAAGASAGAPVHAQATLVGGVGLQGAISARATDGLLDLSAAPGHPISLSFASARGEQIDRYHQLVHTGLPIWPHSPGYGTPNGTRSALSLGATQGATITCKESCFLVLASSDPLGVETDQLALHELDRPRTFRTSTAGSGPDSEYVVTEPAGTLEATGAAGTPVLPSHVHLVLLNATLHTSAGEIDTFEREEPRSDAPGQPLLTQAHTRWVWLDLVDPRIEGLSPFTLEGTTDAVDVQGRLAAGSAAGDITVGWIPHSLGGGTLALEGALQVAVSGSRQASGLLAPAPEPMRISLVGTATRASAAGVDLLGGLSAQKAAVAGGVTILGLLAVAGALALYTRIAPSRALKHPMRQRIHALLLERPAATTADLVRWTGAHRIVVRHHLRMLENSGHVASQRHGAIRCYHVVGEVAPREVERSASVRDPTRRAIAALVAGAPAGLTQRDLVERTGFSQRLVSYHLGRLEQAGFLEPHDGASPRRYRASPLAPALSADAASG